MPLPADPPLPLPAPRERFDGMPLATELVAGRLPSLGRDNLHARLDRSLDLLGDGRSTAVARHRTLRAMVSRLN